MELAVKKQKFTSDTELAALGGTTTTTTTTETQADVEAKRQEAITANVQLLNAVDIRRPNGSIGTQGFDPSQMKDLVKFISDTLGLSIPVDLLDKSVDTLKPLIDYIKSNEDIKNKIIEYIKTNPSEISTLPDGTIQFLDGNHRANLLNIIGSDVIPVITQEKKKEIDAEYEKATAALKNTGAATTKTEPEKTEEIKGGVKELFDADLELASIGTLQQYSQYLTTIFPDSQEKNIVYHGGNIGIENLGRFYKPGEEGYKKNDFNTKEGIYFAYNKTEAEGYTKKFIFKDKNKKVYSALVNVRPYDNVKQVEKRNKDQKEIDLVSISKEDVQWLLDNNYNALTNKGRIRDQDSPFLVVFEPEQIYILGTKQDKEGFKKFVSGGESIKTEEEEVDEEINSNPEDSDDVKEGESRIDDTSREVEQEMDEAQRRANEGKTPPFSELAKETMQSIKDALGSVRDAMKKSYSRMPQALENNYEKLRRAYKKTGGKLKEKLAKVLDSIQKYLRKLKQILIKASKTVGARRVKRGVQPNAGTPEMSSTKPQVVDNTREILADFVVEQLTQYGFVKFFAEQGMTIDANTILNLEALGTKRGDNVLLENRSTMENTLHRILHMYMDRTGPKSDKDYNAQAQSLINILRPVLQEISKAGGDPNVGVYIEKINYMFDKNPAQELVIQYLTNTPFRSFISRLSPEIQAQFQSLAKEMVLFKDSAGRVTYNKTKSFIKIQDGLLMSDALYEEFINNTLQTPLDVLGDAMASGMDPVTFLLNRIAQPIDVFIAEEASAEDLQEIADEEGKSITDVVTSIKNAVLNYLNTANFARSKTQADKAPRTKKDGIISRIIRRLKKMTIGLMIALSTYTGVAGFDFSGNTEAEIGEEMAERPVWSMNNLVDNTMVILPIPDAYKQTIYRGLIKYGVYDISAVKEQTINSEDISEAKAVVETNDTLEYVRQNTYFQNLGKARDNLGSGGDSILMYRSQWFNDVGFEYLTGASNSTRDRIGQATYANTVGVAHFYIMDNTGGDLSRYTTDAKFSEAKRNFKSRIGTYDVKPTDYVPVFKFMPRNEAGENVVKMRFKLASEITDEDNAITKLIQWKFGDIDFNSQADLYKASNCLTTKSGDKAYSFTFSKKAKGKDLYSRFSGSTVIFIFNDQKGNTIVREFTGSINSIKKEGESIMQQFQVKPEDLTIGAFDAGSFSAKPASKNGVLKSDQWDGFNKVQPNAGSALIIPIGSTQKVIQLSDINPSEEEINNVAQEKTKSCQ
jgi:hypothetical protein